MINIGKFVVMKDNTHLLITETQLMRVKHRSIKELNALYKQPMA